MKKFSVEVTLRQTYDIEIDEAIYNEEWKKDFERNFWDLPDGLESVVRDLACNKALNRDSFIEGYGVVKIDGEHPNYDDVDKCVQGLNIEVNSENEDIEYDIIELY